MTLTPTTDHLTRVLKNLRADETRLQTELSQTQAAIASHLKTIKLIEEYEHSNTEQNNQGTIGIL